MKFKLLEEEFLGRLFRVVCVKVLYARKKAVIAELQMKAHSSLPTTEEK